MKKPTVAVIFGSRSAEHDVSIITAIAAVIKPLELTKKYEVVPIYIAKDGKWYCNNKLKDIKLYTSGKIEEFLRKNKSVSIQFNDGLIIQKPGLKNTNIRIDIAFPATHGTHGEDGELMAVLEMANIPYVGCDVPASVVSMDKILSKIVAADAGVSTSKYEWFYVYKFAQSPDEIMIKLQKLNFPLFVKPAHLGSSIGITRVSSATELKNAIEVAAFYDDKILVEEAVNNLIEVTVPIMGNQNPTAAMVEKPLLKTEDFFDFETKYMQGGKKGKGRGGKQAAQGYSQIPAELPGKLYDTSISTAISAYKALGCCGIARVDLLIDSKAGIVYFNEINPLPGDLYAHNWRAAGVPNVELVTRLIDLAIERHQAKQKLATTFSTNYLKQF
jgi:D-alanine-D-alanine ligase